MNGDLLSQFSQMGKDSSDRSWLHERQSCTAMMDDVTGELHKKRVGIYQRGYVSIRLR